MSSWWKNNVFFFFVYYSRLYLYKEKKNVFVPIRKRKCFSFTRLLAYVFCRLIIESYSEKRPRWKRISRVFIPFQREMSTNFPGHYLGIRRAAIITFVCVARDLRSVVNNRVRRFKWQLFCVEFREFQRACSVETKKARERLYSHNTTLCSIASSVFFFSQNYIYICI